MNYDLSREGRLLTLRCVEPTPRLCAGTFGYVHHRFEIKGGITPLQVWSLTTMKQARRVNKLYACYFDANGQVKKGAIK